MKVLKAYKFKVKNVNQAVSTKLDSTLDLCRELYNSALQERRDAWKLNRISITYQDQQNQLPEIKEIREDLKTVHSQILQDVLKRLDKTFKSFFSRVKKGVSKVGFPRFRSQNRFDSFTFPQSGFSLSGNKLTLSKIGTVRLRLSRKIVGKVKTLTLKKELNNWFAIFTIETESEVLSKTGQEVGIDAGIESFMTLSNGTQIENLRFLKSFQAELKRKQRSVSRKKKGSQSRKKAVYQLRKVHQKIKNQRNDFAHKLSTKLVADFDLIAIEDLQIKNMVHVPKPKIDEQGKYLRNGKRAKSGLNQAINDVAWNNFYQQLEYKAESAGKKLIKVNPSGTSQTCVCGNRVEKSLNIRWHHCEVCGLSEHRDIVSAKVILSLGLRDLNKTKAVAL